MRVKLSEIALISLIFMFGSLIFYSTLSREPNYQYYLDIMNHLSSSEVKMSLRSKFDRNYNYSEILDWLAPRMHYVQLYPGERLLRGSDPVKILESGRGLCEEYSIVYTALCIAHGYDARIVVAYGVDSHAWTEVKVDGNWVTIEPVDRYVDQPLRRLENGRRVTLVIAYEVGKFEEVTWNYRR